MEVVGTFSSAITLFEIAQKLNSLYVNVKNAESEWQRYRDGIRAVACIQNVLETILPKCFGIAELAIQVKGQQSPVPLVKHLNNVLTAVMMEADTLVQRHDALLSRWKGRLAKAFKVFKLVLTKEHLMGMSKHVEQAHDHLHMALTLASLHTSINWHYNADSLLNEIKTDLSKHGEVLDRLAKGGRLAGKTLEIDAQKRTCDSEGLPNTSASMDSPQNRGFFRGILRTIKWQKRRDTKPPKPAKPPRNTMDPGHSTKKCQQGSNQDDDCTHDADDDDSGDDEVPHMQDVGTILQQGESCAMMNDSEYQLVGLNGKLLQEPSDSAIGPTCSDSGSSNPPVARILDEEHIESLPEAEWDEALNLPAEKIIEYLTSAQPTAYGTDIEPTTLDSHIPILIKPHGESCVSLSQVPNLLQCGPLEKEGVRLRFCIERVSVTDTMQSFYAIEPCAGQYSLRCKHISLELEYDQRLTAVELPNPIYFTSFSIRESSEGTLHGNSGLGHGGIATFSCNQRKQNSDGGRHRHTVCDQDVRVQCAFPVDLIASPQIATDESDASTERARTESGNDDDITENIGGQRAHHIVLRLNPNSGDDHLAFRLLDMIIQDDTYEPPPKVDIDLLIQFIYLMEEHKQIVGGKPLTQARIWASSIQLPETFSRNTVPLLWILWKLRMEAEFKKLSSSIPQQAHCSISQWQDGSENEFGIRLPKLLLDQLDDRRFKILSMIRAGVATAIEGHRLRFAEAAKFEEDPRSVEQVLRSSFAFGYLKLQSEIFLKPQYVLSNDGAVDFSAVSFADVKQHIISMVDLENWEIYLVPLTDRIPMRLTMAIVSRLALVPLIGGVMHNQGLHVQLSPEAKGGLVWLIRRIEEEDWGVNLDEIGW